MAVVSRFLNGALACLLAAAIGNTAIAGGVASEALSPNAFKGVVLSFLEQEFGDAMCAQIDDAGRLMVGQQAQLCDMQVKTDTLYQRYISEPELIDDQLEHFAETVKHDLMTAHSDVLRASELVVVLRSVRQMPELASAETPLVSRPFLGDLYEVLMINKSHRLIAARQVDLQTLKLTADDAITLARQQLSAHLGAINAQVMHEVTLQVAASGLASGLPLMQESCTSNTQDAFWYVFDKNMVMTANTDNPVAVSNLLKLSRQAKADQTAFSDTVLMCRKGRWAERTDSGDVHFASDSRTH